VGVNPGEVLGGNGERFRIKYGISGPIVYYLGTTAYDKGTFHLVEAMERLWAAGNEASLVLAGPTMDHFTRFLAAKPADVRRRVHLLGFIPEEDKKDLLDAGATMVMPSRTDSLGIVYLEAWLYGKPVIGARAGGVPEVIDDGADGFLVRFGDVKALAERIGQLLADPGLAAQLGDRGRRKVFERYTWDRIYAIVRDVYERLGRDSLRTAGRTPELHSR
jgi:glycogen synthase